MGIVENKDAIERFLSPEVFFGGEENFAVVDDVFDPGVVWLSPGNGEEYSRGTDVIDDIKRELRSYVGEEGEREIAILEQIAEGESVATRYRLELPWGKYVGVTLSRFADGKIREYRVVVTPEEEPEKEYRVAGHGHN
jgi:hypothetical protein